MTFTSSNVTFRSARSVSVDEYQVDPRCVADPATASDTEQTVCMLKSLADHDPARTYVRIAVPVDAKAGDEALVCLTTPSRSITGVAKPLTGGLYLRSARHVRIESSGVSLENSADPLPAPQDWSWCS